MTGVGGPSGLGDVRDPSELLDDETVDALIAGHPVDGRLDALAAFAHDVRALTDRPVPRPSAALLDVVARLPARILTRSRTAPSPDRPHRSSLAAGVAGLGVLGKIAAGALVGAGSIAAAGAAGVLPEPVSREVRHLIEVTTPIDFSGNAADLRSPDRPTTRRPPPGIQGVDSTAVPASGDRVSKPQAEPVRPHAPPQAQQAGSGQVTAPGQQAGSGQVTAPGQQAGSGQVTAQRAAGGEWAGDGARASRRGVGR